MGETYSTRAKGSNMRLIISPIAMIRDVFMAIILIWLVCPYQLFFENWYIYGALWGCWIIFALFADSLSFNYMAFSKYTWAAMSWPLSMLVLSLFGWAEFSPYQFTIVLVVSAFVYYAKGNHIQALKFFAVLFCIYAIMISSYSIQQLNINPEICRILANSDKSITGAYAGPFMANFSFINGMTLVLIVVFFYFYTTDVRLKKMLALVFFIGGAYLLFCAQYAIAMFLLVAFVAIIILFYNKGKSNNSFKAVCIVVALIILIPFIGSAMVSIADLIPPGYIERKLRSVGVLLRFGSLQQGSDLVERLFIYKTSITTFLNNFFFGVGGKTYGANGLVGAHSQILDNFAYYGVFFGIQFVWYLICVYKNGALFFDNQHKQLYRWVFIAYFIQCILNTSYNEAMLFMAFFIVPSFIYIIQHNRHKSETEAKG